MELKKIKEFIKNEILDIGIEEEAISDDALVRDEIGLDSTEVVELSLALKKQYKKDIEIEKDMTINEIANLIMVSE